MQVIKALIRRSFRPYHSQLALNTGLAASAGIPAPLSGLLETLPLIYRKTPIPHLLKFAGYFCTIYVQLPALLEE